MPASRRKLATNSAMRRRSGERVICVVPETIFVGIADGIDGHHVVDVIALNLPGNARKRYKIVGHRDYMIGINGICQREAKRAARGLAVGAVAVAESVRGRRGDHCDVDMHFAILNRLPSPTVRAQHAHTAHLSLRAIVTQGPIHAAFDAIDDAGIHQFDRGFL